MPTLPEISVEAFKAFRERGTIALRPMTLLYGRNQAGKSTLLRLLSLLSSSLRAEGVPILDMRCPALFGASFKELGWLGRDPVMTPRLELLAPDSGDRYEVQLGSDDDQRLIVNALKIGPKGGPRDVDVRFEATVRATASEVSANYAGKLGNSDWHGQLQFRSPLPEFVPELAQQRLHRIRDALSWLRRLQWLRANRFVTAVDGARRAQCCAADGSDLPDLLRGRADVLDRASDWLRKTVQEQVEIGSDSTGRSQFVLRREGREALPLYLAGEGVRSMLPVVLCACWADADAASRAQGDRADDDGRGGPTALAIEEPESHLHPTLQIELLEKLVETATGGVPVVLETHSVYMLRALQLAVLEERIRPQDVGIHWVEVDGGGAASVRRVDVEADGTLRGWDPETFEEEQQLARQIMDARWQGDRS